MHEFVDAGPKRQPIPRSSAIGNLGAVGDHSAFRSTVRRLSGRIGSPVDNRITHRVSVKIARREATVEFRTVYNFMNLSAVTVARPAYAVVQFLQESVVFVASLNHLRKTDHMPHPYATDSDEQSMYRSISLA